MTYFNRAVLGKWFWMEALWRLVVDIKYNSLRGGSCSKEVGGPLVWECGNVQGGGEKAFLNM